MATPPTAANVGSPSVHQLPPGEKLPQDNQQLHHVMVQQQLSLQAAEYPQPGVVYPPPYQESGSVAAAVQYNAVRTINFV